MLLLTPRFQENRHSHFPSPKSANLIGCNIGVPVQMSNVFHQSSSLQAVQISVSCRNVKLGNSNVH